MKKRFLNRILVLMFFIITSINTWADPLPPVPSNYPHNPYGGTDDELPGASVDQTIIWLIVTGILLSGYHFMKNKKQNIS